MKANARKGFDARSVTIEDLKFYWSQPEISTTGLREIPVSKLVICPKAFQMRRVDPKNRAGISDPAHVTKLRERLGREGALDPIRVLPISYNRFVVFDGFHRAHAYKLNGCATIPALVFSGTPSEAKMEAAKENDKVKKELTTQEKTEYLWTMLCKRPADTHTGKRWTLAHCAEAAKCSLSKAEKMEKHRKRFVADNLTVPERWIDVVMALHAQDNDEEEFSKAVREMGDQLRAILGPLDTPGKIKKVAKAIHYASERAGELACELVGETDSYDALNEGINEKIADEVEEQTDTQLETIMAGAVARHYLSGLSAAMGAGF